MPFTTPLQREYRALVSLAWRDHCQRHHPPENDRKALDGWTRSELKKATGNTSTKHCDSGRDADHALAHFEHLAQHDIKWQQRLEAGDAKRIRHAVKKINPTLLERFKTQADFTAYLLGIVRQSYGLADRCLHQLTNDEIRALTNHMRTFAHRHQGT